MVMIPHTVKSVIFLFDIAPPNVVALFSKKVVLINVRFPSSFSLIAMFCIAPPSAPATFDSYVQFVDRKWCVFVIAPPSYVA